MRPTLRPSRPAGSRRAAPCIALFAGAALLLGLVVDRAIRSVFEQQMAARIETEMASLQDEFHAGGLDRLLALVRSRGRGAGTLDYLVQDRRGAALAGGLTAPGGLLPGWTTLTVAEADGRLGRRRALVSGLGGGLLLVVGDDLGRVRLAEESVAAAFLSTEGLVALLGRAFLGRADTPAGTAETIMPSGLARHVPAAMDRTAPGRGSGLTKEPWPGPRQPRLERP